MSVDQPEFGVRLPVAGPLASPDAIGQTAQLSEELGYDAVWLHDFIIWTQHLDQAHISCGSAEAVEAAGDYPPTFYESLSTLSYVAGKTENVKLGVAVLCLPFREPVLAAKQVATIDKLSKGRLILGIGTGAVKSIGNKDFEVLGISRATKYKRTRDYLAAMKAIWRGESSYSGEFVEFTEAEVYPLPEQQPHPPIWLGGAGPKALQMAGEFGDGWIPGRVSATEYPKRIEEIREHGQAAGRVVDDFTVASEIYACIGNSDEEAMEKSEKTIATLLSRGGFPTQEAQQSFADHALIGGPSTVADKVRAYVEAGVSHFEMKFIYPTIEDLGDQLRLFAGEVAAQFRKDS